ncbi:hypothetical protein GBAR_LOCUS2100 [Geodia barretti]|uniref:Uncharacterized protein n=1 Tax=Geodia barretti TaxID=519541 RepID=A0AA35QZE1_GEOBA|nr:hypothetical protein GBAR_LOCUS2100 [Geodia barretti]
MHLYTRSTEIKHLEKILQIMVESEQAMMHLRKFHIRAKNCRD